MKTSSAKAKGRTLQNKVVEMLLKVSLSDSENDIKPAIMGESGIDIKLSDWAKKHIPFDIECKNQESLNIWSSLKQTEANTEKGRIPLLIFKRNRSEIYCVLKFQHLIDLDWNYEDDWLLKELG